MIPQQEPNLKFMPKDGASQVVGEIPVHLHDLPGFHALVDLQRPPIFPGCRNPSLGVLYGRLPKRPKSSSLTATAPTAWLPNLAPLQPQK